MEPFRLRPMTREDLDVVARLCEGRNVHATEYPRFLALEGAHGWIAEGANGVLGALTAMRAFDAGFLGPVLLAEGPDAVGVGIALLANAVDVLRRSGVPTIDAEAGVEEEAILSGLGFERVRPTLVWERGPGSAVSSGATRPMRVDDLLDVGSLDARAVGYGRKEFLATLLGSHPAGARVAEADGEVAGYALARRSRRGFHVGPLVTREPDAEVAARLLTDVVALSPGFPHVALAPGGSAGLLGAAGFREVGKLARMRSGTGSDAAVGAHAWLVGSRLTG